MGPARHLNKGISKNLIKGSVQRDERGVLSCIIRELLVWDCGAGHSFFSGISCRLVFYIFPFPLVPAKSIGYKIVLWLNGGKQFDTLMYNLLVYHNQHLSS